MNAKKCKALRRLVRSNNTNAERVLVVNKWGSLVNKAGTQRAVYQFMKRRFGGLVRLANAKGLNHV